MISHETMSLFDAPEGAILVHACNSQGVWGSGIAKPFKEKYPGAYEDYRLFCRTSNEEVQQTACGKAGLSGYHKTDPHIVGWLVTSHNYGSLKDSPELIKIHTTLALRHFCEQINSLGYLSDSKVNVYSNKFNSGLFAVPWEDSELILKTVLKSYPRINWIVCSEAK